jgi:hypothetical protein
MFRIYPIALACFVAGAPLWSSDGIAGSKSEAKKAEDSARAGPACGARAASAPCLVISQAVTTDTPVGIISDHIRRQGYSCDEPRQAEHDRTASRPNEAVWILRCANAAYRVTLIPDMAARVELVK